MNESNWIMDSVVCKTIIRPLPSQNLELEYRKESMGECTNGEDSDYKLWPMGPMNEYLHILIHPRQQVDYIPHTQNSVFVRGRSSVNTDF